MGILSGILTAGLGGTAAGSLGWPMKLMKKFQFEQIWLPGMLFGLLLIPWTITLVLCPNALTALGSVDLWVFIKANIFSLAWGIGNVLLGISLVRIGSSLSFAILSGIGIPLGVIIPMIFKGSGVFEQAPDLFSPAGTIIMVATILMLAGVVFVTMAGFGRDKMLKTKNKKSGGFRGGLIMCIVSGICSVGPAFAFVYSQAPIRNAMIEQGAEEWPASIAVWASSMFLGVMVNVLYPAYLMTKKKTWHVLKENSKEMGLSLIVGFNLFLAFGLWGLGMLLLGPLGASLGFGLYFAFQILAAQGLGWISGEWKGVKGKPISLMFIAIAILIIASAIMAYAAIL
jgi:L-rhamnose-H+ transport protein